LTLTNKEIRYHEEMRQFSSFIYCSLLPRLHHHPDVADEIFFRIPARSIVASAAPLRGSGGKISSSSSSRGGRSSAASAAAIRGVGAAAGSLPPPANQDEREKEKTLSVAVLGGGISGLSCASELLSRHKQQRQQRQSSSSSPRHHYDLEVTLFDTGRLRPGGRCSSRLPGDASPAVKNRSSGTYPVTAKTYAKGDRNNRRACGNEDKASNNGVGNGDDDESMQVQVPMNIQRAILSPDQTVTRMGPVDHAAQILTVPASPSSSFDEFRSQLQLWLEAGVVERFPEGTVCELSAVDDDERSNSKLEPFQGHDMYYGKGGMGSIPIAMRQFCLSFNGYGENYTGQSFRILQDVWVSPSNGVKYIGSNEDGAGGATQLWELWDGKKSLGRYHRLVISHNGKCGKFCPLIIDRHL
jgi:hypothetical protein